MILQIKNQKKKDQVRHREKSLREREDILRWKIACLESDMLIHPVLSKLSRNVKICMHYVLHKLEVKYQGTNPSTYNLQKPISSLGLIQHSLSKPQVNILCGTFWKTFAKSTSAVRKSNRLNWRNSAPFHWCPEYSNAQCHPPQNRVMCS